MHQADAAAKMLRALLDDRDRMANDCARFKTEASMVLSTVMAPDNGIQMVIRKGRNELSDEVIEFVLRANATTLASETIIVRQPSLDGGRGAVKAAMTRLSERLCSTLFAAAMKAFD